MGERHDGREIIKNVTKRLVKSGMSPELARKKATETRIRREQKSK